MPALAVIDGNPGLARALREQWPRLRIQRCTAHKLRNLEGKAPQHAHAELREQDDGAEEQTLVMRHGGYQESVLLTDQTRERLAYGEWKGWEDWVERAERADQMPPA